MKGLLIILSVLSSFLTNLETKTLQSDFTVTVAEEVNAPMNYPGTITMHGNCFRLSMFGIDAAYHKGIEPVYKFAGGRFLAKLRIGSYVIKDLHGVL